MITKSGSRWARRGATTVSGRESRPFVWLKTQALTGALPRGAEHGLAYLQFIAGMDDARISRQVVDYSIRRPSPRHRVFPKAPTMSVLNRRRRVARLWVNAVLAGDVSVATLHALTHVWLPQLAGTGPDARRAGRTGRAFVEYLRGAFTAAVFGEPSACLLRQARALYALETVLGAHLRAIRIVTQPKRAASQ